MRPQRCRSSAGAGVTPRGASLSGVRAASWRLLPTAAMARAASNCAAGVPRCLRCVCTRARHTCGLSRDAGARNIVIYLSRDILPVSWRLPRSGAPD